MNSEKILLKLTEKWHIKVLAVAAALVLSVFYRMNTLETRFFSAPLRIEANSLLLPASSYPQIVRITIRGEAGSINHIQEEDIEAFVNLSRFTEEGTYRIPVQIRRKGSALGVQPLEITVEPIEIHVRLENKVTKNISVAPVFLGNVAEGFELVSHYITPNTVIAQGPRSNMENIRGFQTELIDIQGRFEDFSLMINIINNNPFVALQGSSMIEYRGTIRPIIRIGELTGGTAFEYEQSGNYNEITYFYYIEDTPSFYEDFLDYEVYLE